MRAEIRFALGLGLALAGIVVACEESSAPNITQRSNTSGGTSGSTSGGITPPAPDPNFDPNSLLDSGSSLNAGAVCKGVAIGNGTVDQENLVETGAVHLQPTTGDRDRGDFVFRTYMQPRPSTPPATWAVLYRLASCPPRHEAFANESARLVRVGFPLMAGGEVDVGEFTIGRTISSTRRATRRGTRSVPTRERLAGPAKELP